MEKKNADSKELSKGNALTRKRTKPTEYLILLVVGVILMIVFDGGAISILALIFTLMGLAGFISSIVKKKESNLNSNNE